MRFVLVIGSYTKAANDMAGVYAFPWIGLKSTTSFIIIVHSFTCCPNHNMGPSFTCAPTQGQLPDSSKSRTRK